MATNTAVVRIQITDIYLFVQKKLQPSPIVSFVLFFDIDSNLKNKKTNDISAHHKNKTPTIFEANDSWHNSWF